VDQRNPSRNQLIVSYLFLRQTVGWIGTLLPIGLLVGSAISSTAPRPDSMSGYYYTDMRNIFVGALCALGVFLVAYDDGTTTTARTPIRFAARASAAPMLPALIV
jgi:hypothetical protein